jgi:uncharacterized phosphosugar-binding protein
LTTLEEAFHDQVERRISALAATAAAGGFDEAIGLLADSIAADGVIQAFGTGHSQAFAMEIAGRAGGLIPTNRIALADLVLRGGRTPETLGSKLEREPWLVDELFGLASNSGVNGSIVGLALKAKEAGHRVIAVTSLQHTNAVTPKHASNKRLSEIADVVIDNLAPYGDSTLDFSTGPAAGIKIGAVSSLTAAYIAQLLTIGTVRRLADQGYPPPVYLSANMPGGDEHNDQLEARYGKRLARNA